MADVIKKEVDGTLNLLGGPFADGFAELNTARRNHLQVDYRNAQRPRVSPIAPAKMKRSK